MPNRDVARKSLVVARRIRAGDRLNETNVTAKRPGTGRSPMDWWDLLGTSAPRDLEPDEPL
jgi:N-acetylneuraminate synthase